MTVFITKADNIVILRASAKSPDGSIADIHREVRPGESSLGKTYEEWLAVETGTVEL